MSKRTETTVETTVETTAEEQTMNPTMNPTEQFAAAIAALARTAHPDQSAHYLRRLLERLQQDVIYHHIAAPASYARANQQALTSGARARQQHMDRANFYYGAAVVSPTLLEAVQTAYAAIGGDPADLMTADQERQRQALRQTTGTNNRFNNPRRVAAPADIDASPF